MRRALWLLLALPLVLVDSPAVAQDAPAVDPFNLYKQVGRAWTTRTVTWQRGKTPVTEYRKQEVTLVKETLCTLKTSILDKDGFLAGSDQSRDLRFDEELKASIAPAKGAAIVRLNIAGNSFVCTLSELATENTHEQTWRSAKYPALLVRQRIVRKDFVETRELLSFDEGVPDAWTLYRMAGRKWIYRVNEALKGPEPKTTYLVNEVIESGFEGAKVKVSYLDKDKKPVEGDLGDTKTINFETATPWKRPEMAKDQEVLDGTLTVGRVKWTSIEVRGMTTTTWYSKHWPGLMLKQSTENSEIVLDEFYTGHDDGRFFRKAGNYYLMRQTFKAGRRGFGDNSSYTRVEVLSVENNQAKLQTSNYDSNMVLLYSGNHTQPFSKPNVRASSGDEPIEERISGGAGVFQALKIAKDEKGNKWASWTHHGLTLRSSAEGDGYTQLAEVTQLKLE